jgi:hypothetical protein
MRGKMTISACAATPGPYATLEMPPQQRSSIVTVRDLRTEIYLYILIDSQDPKSIEFNSALSVNIALLMNFVRYMLAENTRYQVFDKKTYFRYMTYVIMDFKLLLDAVDQHA